MVLKALIFDVDGTLAETETLHLKAMNASFAAEGLKIRWHAALYRQLLQIPGGRNRLRRFLGETLSARDPGALDRLAGELHAGKDRTYRRLLASGALDLRPGVRRLIGEARSVGVRLAIATATSRSNVEALLRNTFGAGALDWFEVVCTVEDAPTRKPAPDAYLEVLSRLDLPGDACLALEDSGAGVGAAAAAGIPVVVTQNQFTEDDAFDDAIAVLSDLGDPDRPYEAIRVPPTGRYPHVDVAQLRHWHMLALQDRAARTAEHAVSADTRAPAPRLAG